MGGLWPACRCVLPGASVDAIGNGRRRGRVEPVHRRSRRPVYHHRGVLHLSRESAATRPCAAASRCAVGRGHGRLSARMDGGVWLGPQLLQCAGAFRGNLARRSISTAARRRDSMGGGALEVFTSELKSFEWASELSAWARRVILTRACVWGPCGGRRVVSRVPSSRAATTTTCGSPSWPLALRCSRG